MPSVSNPQNNCTATQPTTRHTMESCLAAAGRTIAEYALQREATQAVAA